MDALEGLPPFQKRHFYRQEVEFLIHETFQNWGLLLKERTCSFWERREKGGKYFYFKSYSLGDVTTLLNCSLLCKVSGQIALIPRPDCMLFALEYMYLYIC